MILSDEAARFADQHVVARLATADASGAPHAVPICFARREDLFYFVVDEKPKRSRTGLKRLRNIAANPQVALVIDDYDDDWRRLAYLLVQGRAVLVGDAAEYDSTLAALRQRYSQYRSMNLAFATNPMVRIAAERAHYWRASS